MNCLISTERTKEITKEVQKFYPKETEESILNLIGTWQTKNKKGADEYPSIDDIKDFISKRNLVPDIELNKNTNKESNNSSIYTTFTPTVRRDRVLLLSRLFSNEVTKAMSESLKNLNDRLLNATTESERVNIQSEIAGTNRISTIREYSPKGIYDRVLKTFTTYYNASEDLRIKVELDKLNKSSKYNSLSSEDKIKKAKEISNYKHQEYKKIIDNFKSLAEEASTNLITSEGILIEYDYKEPLTSNETDDLTRSENIVTPNSEIDTKEETIKEGWMVNFREVSANESLSQEVRKVISEVYKYDSNGNIEVDDLGYPRFLDSDYVHVTLLDTLKNMVTSEDMLPLLESLRVKYKWITPIINKINSDNTLYSKFYKNYRKDFTNYWIQTRKLEKDGTYTMKTSRVNNADNVMHYIEEWSYNYESGDTVDSDSIYDQNSNIKRSNIDKGIKILDSLNNTFSNLNKEQQTSKIKDDSIFNNILKVVRMAGIDVNPTVLKNSLLNYKDTESISYSVTPIKDLLSNLYVIYKGINKLKSFDEFDLFDEYESAYMNIASILSELSEESFESSFRENGKSYYSYNNPNYLGKTIKQLKNCLNDINKFKEYIQKEFKDYDWFYKNGEWRSVWLELIESKESYRNLLDHKVLLHVDNEEYKDWKSLTHLTTLLTEYWSGETEKIKGGDNVAAWYHVPIMSDAASSEFIKFVRYRDDMYGNTYEDIIIDKLSKLVMQEYDRIMLVRERANNPSISPIANFDITEDSNGGNEFKFLPSLNSYKTEDGTLFIDKLGEYVNNSDDAEAYELIKEALTSIMNKDFEAAYKEWEEIGLFEKTEDGKYKYIPQDKEPRTALREYFYNSVLATSQIIQITTTDLAFYKDIIDFQKRFKEVHAPSTRLNTKAVFNGERLGRDFERTIYIADEEIKSSIIDSVKSVLDAKVKSGELSKLDRDYILSQYNKVNVADAQAYRSLSSYRAILAMQGEWTEDMQKAFDNLKNGNWSIADFNTIWQTKKPFLYTQIGNQSGVEGRSKIKTPVQHKNSEFLLLASYALTGGNLYKSGKLKAINDFMEKHNIDVVQFESTTKVGKQGVISLKGLNSYDEVMNTLENSITKDGAENPDVVHTVSYEDYGIQVETPEHFLDATQSIGTQLRKLITADISDDAILEVAGIKLTKKEWLDLYNKVNTENILQSYLSVKDIFKDKTKVERELKEEIRKNKRYGMDMLKACSLNESGRFNIPLFEQSQSARIQSLLNSIIKNRITKQKTRGGSLIQVSSYGVTEDLNIVFKDKDGNILNWETYKKKNRKATKEEYDNIVKSGLEEGNISIAYYECYLPAYSKQFYSHLLKEGSHVLSNELPEDLKKAIGYRIPTEDKYSMIPIYIKGFLPQQNGSAIMLPAEITTITGSDYDIDKMYIMLPEFNTFVYDKEKAKLDFDKQQRVLKNLSKQLDNSNLMKDLSDTEIDFETWFKEHKNNYKVDKLTKIKYDFNKSLKDNGTKARNNLIIDLMWGVLTNPDTTAKMLNPGGFDPQKKASRIMAIVKNNTSTNLYKTLISKGFKVENNTSSILKYLKEMSLSDLNKLADEFTNKLNPLSPSTQLVLHEQNMTGGSMIGVYANHNANHALVQHTNLEVSEYGSFTYNGVKLTKLNNIKSKDGNYISRNNAGFLAASVDNAKDPVLAGLNQNMFTVDASMLLSRLGYDALEIAILMNQPIIVDMTKAFFAKSNEYSSKESVVDTILRDYKERSGVTESLEYENVADNKFSIDELFNYLYSDANTNKDFNKNQLYVGLLFKQILNTATKLSDIVSATKVDTANGGAGPSIADTVSKIQRIEKVFNDAKKDNYPLKNVDGIIDNSFEITEDTTEEELREYLYNSKLPYIQAFYLLGLKSSKYLLEDYFPHFNEFMTEAVRDLASLTKSGRLSADTINNIYNDALSYLLTKFESFGDGKNTNLEKRSSFINGFPKYFKEFVEKNKDAQNYNFLKKLKVVGPNRRYPVPVLIYKNAGKTTIIKREKIMRDFESLMYDSNPEINNFVNYLHSYSFYRNGFNFGNNSFSHLIPTVVKTSIVNYIDDLYSILENNEEANYNFVDQYIYNHLDNRQFAPKITSKSSVKLTDGNKVKKYLEFEMDNNFNDEDNKIVRSKDKTDDGSYIYDFMNFICVEKSSSSNVYYRLDVSKSTDTKAVYKLIEPLGYRNTFTEYDYNLSSEEMSTVINRNTIKESDISDNVSELSVPEYKVNSNNVYTGEDTFGEQNPNEVPDAEGKISCK